MVANQLWCRRQENGASSNGGRTGDGEVGGEQADVRWIYGYRYSPFGGREQKRLKYSPYADACEYTHDWTYYQKGAFGENLAIYAGRQTFDEYGSYYGRPGRYVSFYAAQYVVDGGNLAVLADGTKEYSIKDHLGSVRVVANTNGQLRQYDYKPYGDTLQSGSYNNLRGYEGSERDPESRYMNLGARLYDPIIGRFLSVDPLWEAFPSWSPYQYAYNCPVSYKDPTGLAPQKEKGDRVMAFADPVRDANNESKDVVMSGQAYLSPWNQQKEQAKHFWEMDIEKKRQLDGGDGSNTGSSSNGGRTASQETSSNGSGSFWSRTWGWLTGLFSGSSKENASHDFYGPYENYPEYKTEAVDCVADRYPDYDNLAYFEDAKSTVDWLGYFSDIMQTERIGGIGLGSNGKLYTKSLTGGYPYLGGKTVTVTLAKNVGKNIGNATFAVGIFIEGYELRTGKQSTFRFCMDVGVMSYAFYLGGVWGIACGLTYNGLMSEFVDRPGNGPGWYTGSNGLFPADNTTTFYNIYQK